MRVALVHDHLTQNGGAEKVLAVMSDMFPEAPIYTLIYDAKAMEPFWCTKEIRPSFLQRVPGSRRHLQWLLPLMPWATESHNLIDFDLVLSSTSAFAKGVLTSDRAKHLSYCHTPTRFLWSDTFDYVENLHKPSLIKKFVPGIFPALRVWDAHASSRPDVLIANSEAVRRRMLKFYRRDGPILHPPVDVASFKPSVVGDYYLTGGRLVWYKHFELVVEAFNRLKIPLKVFGDGPWRARLEGLAKSNVEILGNVSMEIQQELYSHAIAFVNPQEEDFGITAVEAMAAGRPVIAYAAGGALETVVEKTTGVFFAEQTWEAIADAVLRFEHTQFSSAAIRQHAEKFSRLAFEQGLRKLISQTLND